MLLFALLNKSQFLDSVDFIYVDATHDYCHVRDDMKMWWPKVKPYGILAGW